VAKKLKSSRGGEFPSEAEILDFLSQSKVGVGKREIIRAFGLKGEQKSELRRLLRAMAEEGKINRRGRRVRDRDALAEVAARHAQSAGRDGRRLRPSHAMARRQQGDRGTAQCLWRR
jgi:ribonuclease R